MVANINDKSKYRHITCSQQFRDLIAEHYPGLNQPKTKEQRNAYWSLFLYCLCGKRNEQGTLLLYWEILSELEYGSIVTNYSHLLQRASTALPFCIKDLPQPIYKGSDKPGSTRIYAFGQNLTQLSRPVRAALFQGVYSVDLASIQLAIAAAVLNVETITEFLSQGNSFWTELLDYFQIQPSHRPAAKSILKESTYSLVFRAERHNVKRNLTVAFKKLDIAKAGQKFYQHPFIKELDLAMEQKGEEIVKAGGIENAFGQYVPYQDNVKSSLALLFQSYESYLMSSVYDLPFENMSVVAHLHDGLYISFRNQKYYELLSKQIEAAVNQRLEELNIPSRLEWEYIDEKKVEAELQAKQLEHQIKTNTLQLSSPVVAQALIYQTLHSQELSGCIEQIA